MDKIQAALREMRVNFNEPVFINFYRKEYVLPDLKIDDLWRIYFYDGEYCKLQSRKKALRTLFEQCQKYQQETICANLDAEIPKDVRLVKVRYFFLPPHPVNRWGLGKDFKNIFL